METSLNPRHLATENAMARNELERRMFLRCGTLALFGGLASARLQQAHAAGAGSASRGRAKNCILVYLLGGPPHLDMWDMKPDAPREIRGEFQPIPSAVPGVFVSEHLPRMAARTDRTAIVRSLSFPNNDHPYMIYHTLTGRVSPVPLGANTVLPPTRGDHPHLGSVVSRLKHTDPQVPGYVAIPEVQIRMKPTPVSGGGRAGYLGPAYDPLAVNDDPREPMTGLSPPQEVSRDRLGRRKHLLAIFDGKQLQTGTAGEYDSIRGAALQLSVSNTSGGMLDLNSEPAPLRECYGRHRFGQSLLLARRLVERGVSFVGCHFNHMTKCDGWDTHQQNFSSLKGELLPLLDQGVSALLDDLSQRGLLDETLVVVMGEFGRTPKINTNAGRDHWGLCGSAVFAGGGVQGGTVIGASDKIGSAPIDHRVGPPDVVASIYHALGLDPHTIIHDHLGRPLPLSTGQPIASLF